MANRAGVVVVPAVFLPWIRRLRRCNLLNIVMVRRLHDTYRHQGHQQNPCDDNSIFSFSFHHYILLQK